MRTVDWRRWSWQEGFDLTSTVRHCVKCHIDKILKRIIQWFFKDQGPSSKRKSTKINKHSNHLISRWTLVSCTLYIYHIHVVSVTSLLLSFACPLTRLHVLICATANAALPTTVMKITTTHKMERLVTKIVNHFILPPAMVVPVQGQK